MRIPITFVLLAVLMAASTSEAQGRSGSAVGVAPAGARAAAYYDDVVAGPGQSEVVIENTLSAPIRAFLGGQAAGTVGARATERFVLPDGRHSIMVQSAARGGGTSRELQFTARSQRVTFRATGTHATSVSLVRESAYEITPVGSGAAVGFAPACSGQAAVGRASGRSAAADAPVAAASQPASERPITATVIVNHVSFSTVGYKIDGKMYFQLQDIAKLLSGTRAQFDLRIDGKEYHITRGFPYEAIGPKAVTPKAAAAVPATVRVATGIQMDGVSEEFTALDIGGGIYFTPDLLSGFLGYTVACQADGNIVINTDEPQVTIQGRRAAEEFLSGLPTLFYEEWNDRMLKAIKTPFVDENKATLYPKEYILLDFNDDGVPEILVHYDADPWALRRSWFLFVFVNGKYTKAGEIQMWGDLYRDGRGRIFAIEGGHHNGFTSVRQLALTARGAEWKTIVDNSEAIFWAKWSFLTPTVPDNPNEPMTSMRPMQALKESITETVAKKLKASGRFDDTAAPASKAAGQQISGNTFTDSRDNQTYRTVRTGNFTWMAQNLNYSTGGSLCYGNNTSNCAKYGRFYNWEAAMKACPAGWRLPDTAAWNDLARAAGGTSAGMKLRAKTGWLINGTDDYGFSALAGGCSGGSSSPGEFSRLGEFSAWWTATEVRYDAFADPLRPIYRFIYSDGSYLSEYHEHKTGSFFVRCVRE